MHAAECIAAAQQAVPPAAGLAKAVDHRRKAGNQGIVVRGQTLQLLAHPGQQRGITGHGMGVQKNGQPHQAVGTGHQQPFPGTLAKVADAAAPFRVIQHDVPGAFRVAETLQHRRKGMADGVQIGRWRVSIAQQ